MIPLVEIVTVPEMDTWSILTVLFMSTVCAAWIVIAAAADVGAISAFIHEPPVNDSQVPALAQVPEAFDLKASEASVTEPTDVVWFPETPVAV